MEDYERYGRPKEAITDENVELVHSLSMCDRRRSLRDIARQIGMFGGSSVCLDRYLRVVQGLSQMGSQNVDQRSEEELA